MTVVWSSLQAVHDIGGKIFFSSQLGFEADLAWADWNRAERKKKKTKSAASGDDAEIKLLSAHGE